MDYPCVPVASLVTHRQTNVDERMFMANESVNQTQVANDRQTKPTILAHESTTRRLLASTPTIPLQELFTNFLKLY